MVWDEAFFARSRAEPLLWVEDPVDRPLVAEVPHILLARAAQQAGALMFTSRHRKPEQKKRPVRVGIVRNGQRRKSVAVQLQA